MRCIIENVSPLAVSTSKMESISLRIETNDPRRSLDVIEYRSVSGLSSSVVTHARGHDSALFHLLLLLLRLLFCVCWPCSVRRSRFQYAIRGIDSLPSLRTARGKYIVILYYSMLLFMLCSRVRKRQMIF